MSAAPPTPLLAHETSGFNVLGGLAVVGLVGIAAGAALSPAGTWSGLLTAAIFGITVALGGALFVAVQAVSGGRLWMPIRRVPLLLARTLPVPAVALGLCLVLGLTVLYPWARPEVVEASPLLQKKVAWLNAPLFLARAALILAVWLGLVGSLHRRLRAADRSGAAGWPGLVKSSALFLILFAITISVASWDWLMSLEPAWYSTMYAVYVFAGCFQGGLAAMVLVTDALERTGRIDQVPGSVRHDLGKLLFAMSTFWGYIWFCQMMLIWYSNLPEETLHFASRWSGGWTMHFFLNLALCWVVPFVVLLSIPAKRHPATLRSVAMVVLVGRFLDCHLLVAPALGPARAFPFFAVALTLGVVAGMVLLGRRLLEQDAEYERRRDARRQGVDYGIAPISGAH